MSFDPSGDLVTYGATSVDGNGGRRGADLCRPAAKERRRRRMAGPSRRRMLRYAGPTGLALDSAGNFYVNGALHTALGPQYGLFVAHSASDIGNPRRNPARTIPWDSTTKLTPG